MIFFDQFGRSYIIFDNFLDTSFNLICMSLKQDDHSDMIIKIHNDIVRFKEHQNNSGVFRKDLAT